MARKLQNYLISHRKRFGLTQDESAFLLGITEGSQVCRYESFRGVPSLKTALTCQAVFGVPVAELFAGIYDQVEKETAKRARALASKMDAATASKAQKRKGDLLRAIALTPDINRENP